MSPRPVVIGTRDPVFRTLCRRRTWVLALIGAVLGASIGVVLVLTAPKTFKATVAVELASVAPQINLSGAGPKADPVSVDTDAQLVLSDAVVDAVAALGDRSVSQVREHLMVAARPLTQVITITYAASSAEAARGGAATAADALIKQRERLFVDPVRNYLTRVSDQNVSRTGTTGEGVTAESQDNLWSLELRRQAALDQELGLGNAGSVLEQARITTAGQRGDLDVPVATGLAVGALFGVAVAVLWDLRRRSRSAPAG